MAKQVVDDNKTFTTEKKAYLHGIKRYGSSGYNDAKCGWSIEVKEESFGEWADRNIANGTNEL